MQPHPDTTSKRSAPAEPSSNSVLQSAAMMSLGTLLSRILGLVRDLALAALFPRIITDAYVVAFRLPNLFRRILGEGSLAASFVPVYVDRLGSEAEAKEFSSAIFSMLAIVTATLSVLGILFMEPLLNILVSGEAYQSVEGKVDITVSMARIMFSFLFLVMSYAFLASLHNAHKRFFIPAVAPAGFNLILVIFTLLPAFQFDGDQLAWGVIAGGAFQLLIVMVPLIKNGLMPRLQTKIWVKGVGLFFRNFIPSLIGMSVLQILGLLNVMFASRLPQGSHSYIYLADRLLEFPQSLISVSLGVALLPTLSELWSQNKAGEMLRLSSHHMRLLLSLSLPSAIGLFLLAEPIVKVVFMRGEFDASDALVTSQVLQIYSVVLIFSGLHRILVPSFYAIKNTWLPALLGAFCVLVHYFVADFATDQYGIIGLVSSTAFTGFLNLLLLLVCFQFYFGSLEYTRMLKSLLHLAPSLIVLGGICFYAYAPLEAQLSVFPAFLITFLSAIFGFFLVNAILKHPEANEVLDLFFGRIKRKVGL